ncbi:hypothetical protein [Kitasatospora sp. NPDC088351]|uniref:hypothetical protein n=1 Tax=unclassified Kitasatospora TaxID=2633591 RepID=UPI00344807F4
MTSPQQQPRGLTSLIPTGRTSSAGDRAAAQLLHLRETTLPAPVVAAAAELIADRLDDPDPVTRAAAAAVHTLLTAALETTTPSQ